MQRDLVVGSDSKERFMASVARADARVLAADGRPDVRSNVRVTVALDGDSVVDKIIIVQVAQVIDGR